MSNYVYDRRRFNRTNSIDCKIKVGKELEELKSVRMINISAGGLSYYTEEKNDYKIEEKIYLEMFVHVDWAEISIIIEGYIVRISNNETAVKFVNIESHKQNELDNIINLSIERGIKEMVLFEPSKTFFRNEK
jgi:c-di-GMP-binding flagellar brake protein YcgR